MNLSDKARILDAVREKRQQGVVDRFDLVHVRSQRPFGMPRGHVTAAPTISWSHLRGGNVSWVGAQRGQRLRPVSSCRCGMAGVSVFHVQGAGIIPGRIACNMEFFRGAAASCRILRTSADPRRKTSPSTCITAMKIVIPAAIFPGGADLGRRDFFHARHSHPGGRRAGLAVALKLARPVTDPRSHQESQLPVSQGKNRSGRNARQWEIEDGEKKKEKPVRRLTQEAG